MKTTVCLKYFVNYCRPRAKFSNENTTALLGQVRDSWPSMAHPGHNGVNKNVKTFRNQIQKGKWKQKQKWKSKNKNQNQNENKNQNEKQNEKKWKPKPKFILILTFVFVFILFSIFVFVFRLFYWFFLVLFLNFIMAPRGHHR